MEKCPICQSPAVLTDTDPDHFDFSCFRCGPYRLTRIADQILKANSLSKPQTATLSGYIRKNAGLTIGQKNLPDLLSISAPTVGDRLEAMLLELAKDFPRPGMAIRDPCPILLSLHAFLQKEADKPVYSEGLVPKDLSSFFKWLAIISASEVSELRWFIFHSLTDRGFLAKGGSGYVLYGRKYETFVITVAGWAAIDQLRQADNSASRIGFIAMSFRPEFTELYEQGIAPGIRSAGFEPLRIDRTEHNNRIDDEIIATIRRSRFLVGDFTADRGGIYFEAGYAMGFGIRVIWTVRSDALAAVHFDNRQYNFIRWEDGKWPDLQKALKNRIEATIGRGPLPS
jgi:hypothetical protein